MEGGSVLSLGTEWTGISPVSGWVCGREDIKPNGNSKCGLWSGAVHKLTFVATMRRNSHRTLCIH